MEAKKGYIASKNQNIYPEIKCMTLCVLTKNRPVVGNTIERSTLKGRNLYRKNVFQERNITKEDNY